MTLDSFEVQYIEKRKEIACMALALVEAEKRAIKEFNGHPQETGISIEMWTKARRYALMRKIGQKDADLLPCISTPAKPMLYKEISSKKIDKWKKQINERMKDAKFSCIDFIHKDKITDSSYEFASLSKDGKTLSLSSEWARLNPMFAFGLLALLAGQSAWIQRWSDSYFLQWMYPNPLTYPEFAECYAFQYLGYEIWYAPPEYLPKVAIRDGSWVSFAEFDPTLTPPCTLDAPPDGTTDRA